jgi:hypothetical protein
MIMRMTMTNTHHMMVMPGLGLALGRLVADDLLTIFAKLAIHVGRAFERLLDTLQESIDDQRMVAQIGSFDELNARMLAGSRINPSMNALNQYPGEKEIGKNDDARITQAHQAL